MAREPVDQVKEATYSTNLRQAIWYGYIPETLVVYRWVTMVLSDGSNGEDKITYKIRYFHFLVTIIAHLLLTPSHIRLSSAFPFFLEKARALIKKSHHQSLDMLQIFCNTKLEASCTYVNIFKVSGFTY